jgi:hypothetical protein
MANSSEYSGYSLSPNVYPPMDFSIPGGTPLGVIQQIKCKVCPPPLGPEVANQQLQTVNKMINEQANVIEELEKYITDLEKRYKIRFNPNVNTTFGTETMGNISGNLENITFNLTIVPGVTGPKGTQGPNGNMGRAGSDGPIGPRGPTGYWGNIV